MVYGFDNLAAVDQHAFVIFTTTLLAGSCLAFLSTIGGAVQLTGVAGFIYYAHKDLYGNSWTFEIGFYIALISAIIVCLSIVVAIGPGWPPGIKVRNPLQLRWDDLLTVVFPDARPGTVINRISVASAFVGIYAMGVADWTYEQPVSGHLFFGLDTGRNLFYYVPHQTMGLGPTLIAAGTILLFASSFAVLLMVCGEILFMQSASSAIKAGSIEHIEGGFGIILIVTAVMILTLGYSLMRDRSNRLTSVWRISLTLRGSEGGKI